jgi:negative regulator of flagellin synthesis FlgM
MVTTIKETAVQGPQQYQKGEPVRSEGDKPLGGAAAIATERVDLSAKAKELQRIRKVLDQVPDVREDKVRELKTRIANGEYAVNSGKIADKMLGESLIDTIA